MYDSEPSCYSSSVPIGTCYNGTGTVNLSYYKVTNKQVVIKKFQLDSVEQDEYSLIEQEIVRMRQMEHPNILPYLTAFVSGHSLCVVSPLMAYGSCIKLINEYFIEGLPELAIAFVLRDVLQGLEYLHKRGLIHRAIKASHILISILGQACLSGMRYACVMPQNSRLQKSVFSFPKSTAPNLKWLSPEVLEQDLHGYNEKSDIYSVGVTICELANGIVPFYDVPETLMLTEKVRGCAPHIIDRSTFPGDLEQKHLNGDSSNISLSSMEKRVESLSKRKFSEPFHSITELCLQRDPSNRPSVTQLISHVFFKQCKKSNERLIDILKMVTPIHKRKIEPAAGDQKMEATTEQLANLDLETCQWDFENT